MEASIVVEKVLPAALALVMFGMGVSLSKQDFFRLLVIPKPVIIGLFGQLLLLPIIAYVVAIVFNLNPALAIGLMILAACPGGTMSNVISHMARANLALSVTLTAITTIVCVFSTPFIIKWSINTFSDSPAESFSLLKTTIGLIVITLIPVLLGILVRHFYPNWATSKEEFFRKFSAIFMAVIITLVVVQEWEQINKHFAQVAGATIALNLLAIMTGLLLGKLASLSLRDSITLSIEVGIQNATVAILIAVSFLNDPALAVAAGIYGVTMYLGAIVPFFLSKRLDK